MAIIKSAKKAIRVGARKKVFNDSRRRVMKDAVKKVQSFIKDKNKDEALKILPNVYKAIDKAAKRGVIKKNTASRKKSRLSIAIGKIS